MFSFHTLRTFSGEILRQTQAPATFYFWLWIGFEILQMLSRVALCFALQISFTFLDLLPFLERTWYLLRMVFAIGGFFFLTPLLYRCLYHSAVAAGLTQTPAPTRTYCYRLSLCLHGLRLLFLLPLPFCFWGLRWCLYQGTAVADAVWWLFAAMQVLTGMVLLLIGFLWLLPVCTAASVLQILEPEASCRRLLSEAFAFMAGRRKQWYGFLLQSLPCLLLPHLWSRFVMMQVVYVGVLCKEQQYQRT